MKAYFPSTKVLRQFRISFLVIALISGLAARGAGADPGKKPLVLRAFAYAVTPDIRIHEEAVQFRISTTDLIDESYLREFISSAQKQVGDRLVNITIAGHTCDLGTNEYNKKLGEQRAYAIMDYFVMLDLNINVIEVMSDGESRPVVANSSETNRQKNRRVAITIESAEPEDLAHEGWSGNAFSGSVAREPSLEALRWSHDKVEQGANPGSLPWGKQTLFVGFKRCKSTSNQTLSAHQKVWSARQEFHIPSIPEST